MSACSKSFLAGTLNRLQVLYSSWMGRNPVLWKRKKCLKSAYVRNCHIQPKHSLVRNFSRTANFVPWVPEVFSHMHRGASKAENTSGKVGHFLRPDWNWKPRMKSLWHPGYQLGDWIFKIPKTPQAIKHSRLVFTYNKVISIPFSDILTLVFLKISFFTIFVGNISKWEKKAIINVRHCVFVLQVLEFDWVPSEEK